jgi:hypothetical protein
VALQLMKILIACTLNYSGPTFAFLFSTDLQHSIRISTGLGYCVLLSKINISNPNIPVQAPFGGPKKYISQKNLLCLKGAKEVTIVITPLVFSRIPQEGFVAVFRANYGYN